MYHHILYIAIPTYRVYLLCDGCCSVS